MILWMRSAARTMRAELGGKLEAAMVAGPVAVATTVFLAVAREGIVTVLFLWSSMRVSGGGVLPTLGAAAGLVAMSPRPPHTATGPSSIRNTPAAGVYLSRRSTASRLSGAASAPWPVKPDTSPLTADLAMGPLPLPTASIPH
ncbi:MAG: FTR1 family protein [Acidimicrobiia bacterium]|nr:FTR1 family protein [Acidimicrobiia bacterium]